MSYTGTEIFNQAIAILDELSDTGAVVDLLTETIAAFKGNESFIPGID